MDAKERPFGGGPAGSKEDRAVDPIVQQTFSRFFDGVPVSAQIVDTSRGDRDMRKTAVVTADDGERYVLKFAANDFTFPDRIRVWQRTAEEYRRLGYYCPRIYGDRSGAFPAIEYEGRTCFVHGEEFSKYRTLEDRTADGSQDGPDSRTYARDVWTMTAKIAAKRLAYTSYPSAYCLFETFCPSDETDEVMENALAWRKLAFALPEPFSAQVRRIWDLWSDNRRALQARYAELPASVFQADLNPTNLLVGEDGAFKGVYDFNLCGRDVFLNYLMRENYDGFEKEIDLIREALSVACGHYAFSEAEKAAALPLYRCLKPLWYTRVCELQEAGEDADRIRRCLDRIEYYLTADIDFKSYMG